MVNASSASCVFSRMDYIVASHSARYTVLGSGRVLNVGAPSGDHVPVTAEFRFDS
jgi:hypothetical protein